MKYIDADKLIAEIDRRMENYNATIERYYGKQKSIKAERDSWKWAECKWFLALITSLQREQPDGLDEAAEMYESGLQNPDYQDSGYTDNDMIDAFKAGAEWMEGQGVTCGGRIMKSSTGETYAESDYVPLDGKCGDKVIVQIRKK